MEETSFLGTPLYPQFGNELLYMHVKCIYLRILSLHYTHRQCADLNKFFIDKVANLRSSTSNPPPPTFTPCQADASLSDSTQISADDVITAIRELLDLCPSVALVLSVIVDLFIRFMAKLYNRLLATARLTVEFKDTFISRSESIKTRLGSADVS